MGFNIHILSGRNRSTNLAGHAALAASFNPQKCHLSKIRPHGLGSADELQFFGHDGGFAVLVPALPEVVTEGDTEGQALLNAEEAIRAILAYRRAQGLTIPPDALPEIRRVS